MITLLASAATAFWAAAPVLAADPLPIHPVFDAGCDRAVDLRAAGGPMAHVAIRQQDRENECYAESAAQLVDAWRFGRQGDTNHGHQTSGIALALRTNSDLFGTGVARPELDFLGPELGAAYAGGEACMAVETALDHGSCDERAVLRSLGGARLTDTIRDLRRYYDDYQAWRGEHDTLTESVRVIASGEESKRTRVARSLEARLATLRAGLRVPAAEIGPLLDESATIRFLEGIMTRACSRGHTVTVGGSPDCVREGYFSAEEAHLRLLRRLTRHRLPVAVGFCSGLLREGRRFDEGPWGALPAATRAAVPLTCLNHQVLVIGARRHPLTRKCQYLLRDSQGGACGYSPDWECDRGDVWVDAQNLSYNAYGSSAIE